MRTIIVTAANEAFMPLLRGLIMSLQQWDPRPFTTLACLDVGLGLESREWVSRYASHFVVPEWDLPVDRQLREKEPHLRVSTARPFLPKYFPGYDVYLWIDADAWAQERFALDQYFETAISGSLVAAPQVDRVYRHYASVVGLRTHRMQQGFGDEAGRRALWDVYLNSGVFALRSDAPHWKCWAQHLSKGLDATNGMLCCDQTALNHTLWTENLPLHPLPALYNWTCHLALPSYDLQRGKFCEPFAPSRSIGILHLTRRTKNLELNLNGDALRRKINLRFPNSE